MGKVICVLGLACIATYIILWMREKRKAVLSIFIVLGVFLIAVGAIINGKEIVNVENTLDETQTEKVIKTEPSETTDNTYFNSSEKIENEVIEIDTSMLKILMEAGYTLEHATDIQEILNALGVNSISLYGNVIPENAEKGLNAVVCYANGSEDRDKRFTFTTENGVMFYAGFLGEKLYDIEQGGYLKKYTDVHISEKSVDMETYTTLQVMAEIEVKKHLNYPNSASFGLLNWGVGRSDENYKIIGMVTADNAFGVSKDISFSVWFKQTDNGFTIEAVSLNGERVK